MTAEELKAIMVADTKTWFTPEELAKRTDAPADQVQTLLSNSPLFVRSADNNFSTREEFRQQAGFGTRLLAALKNRID